jgi:signal transduction histidine kinase
MDPPRDADAGVDGDGSTPESDLPAADARPARSWPARYRFAWVSALVVVVVAIGWVHLTIGGAAVTRVFSDLVIAAGATAAALALTALALRVGRAVRTGWRLLALGAWFEALGELSWAAYSVTAGSAPYPGLPDVFYLAGYPILAAGFLAFATDTRDTRPWLRFLLDGLVVGTALLTIGWHYALQPLLATSALGSLGTWVSLAYPIADILVGSIAIVVAINARGPRRVPLLLIGTGIFAWAIGDTTFAAIEFSGVYRFDELALIWLAGDLAIALGALHPDADAHPVPGGRRVYDTIELAFPFIPFVVTMGLLSTLAFTGTLDRGDIVLGTLVVVFLVSRQAYISRDVTRLSRDLEASETALAHRNQELLLLNRIVRHDIRNDMAVAHGWAGELTDHVDEEGEQMLERIRNTTQHTIDLTQTLRDSVAALEPGGEVDLQAAPLRPAIQKTLTSRRETYPHADFTSGDIADVDVRANPLLDTVFRNLLNNAVQHNDAPDPAVHVDTTVLDDHVRVTIADNGPGLPPNRRETVFGRGQAGLDSPGSGVGLYLVDTLVDTYDGAVWVEDNDPRGSVFVVELALADDAASTPA